MKTKFNRIDKRELKNPVVLPEGSPSRAIVPDVIKNISAPKIPAFNTRLSGNSSLDARYVWI